MPQPNQDAASAGVISEQAPAEQSTSTATPGQTETQTTSTSIMDRMGLSAEVQAELKSQQPKQEPEQPETPSAETPTAEAEPVESPETPTEENPSEEQPEAHGDWPESAKKRVAKLSEQKRKAKERAEELEEEIQTLKSTLENTQPVTVTPTASDVLADVNNEQQLEQRVSEWRLVRDWCRKHPNGYTAHEGTDKEEFIAPEVVADRLSQAEDIIMFEAPKKAAKLHQRRQYDTLAQKEYPKVFERGSEDYQVANALVQELPGLAGHPAKNLIVGDYLRGVRERIGSAKKTNGKVNGDAAAEIIRAAKETTPPIAPPVPTSRSNGATPSSKKVDQAMNNLVQQGGSREAVLAAIRARREAGATTTDSRSPVLV